METDVSYICIPDQTKLSKTAAGLAQRIQMVDDDPSPDVTVPSDQPSDTALPQDQYFNDLAINPDPASTANVPGDDPGTDANDPLPTDAPLIPEPTDALTLAPPPPGNSPGAGDGGDVNQPPTGGGDPYYCGTVGCWFRDSSTEVTWVSVNIGYGFIGPDGDKFNAGTISIVTVYALYGTGERTMEINGDLESTTKLGSLDFTAAMTNGAAGKGGGNWIGSKPCLSIGYEKNEAANVKHSPAKNFPCKFSDISNYNHVGTMQFSWTSANTQDVPSGVYWFLFARSLVANSAHTGNSAYYSFNSLTSASHGLNSDPVRGGMGDSTSEQEWSGIDSLEWFYSGLG